MSTIRTLEALRARYADPVPRSLAKQLTALEPHSRGFIAMSPFVVIASVDDAGRTDASPRGGPPGFVRIVDDQLVAIPDASGNNRLDTLSNVVTNGQVSLLFMIPGINETLRINGVAHVTDDEDLMALFADDRHPPRLLIAVRILEVYLHCPKAFMRARLWEADARADRRVLPSLAQIINDQARLQDRAETQDEAERRYRRVLEEDG